VAEPFLSRFLILCLLVFSSCAHGTPLKIRTLQPSSGSLPSSLYALVPETRSLRAVPQFFLIDDFNAKEAKNHLGEAWEIEPPPSGRLRFELASVDSLQQKRGSSLVLKPAIPAGSKGIFKSSLRGSDLSQSEALVLKCRIDTTEESPFPGKVEITLKDFQSRGDTHDLTSSCSSTGTEGNGWKEVILPRTLFPGIDWNQLNEIAFVISADGERLRTRVRIDEIAFYGRGDVEFDSQRDNLIGFPRGAPVKGRVAELLAETESERFLYEIAKDTWKYFENAIDKNTQLPVDHIRVGEPGGVGTYTTPTNLAMYFLACVAARELGIISKGVAVKRIRKTMETLRIMKRWKGFHYNFYDTVNLRVTRPYVSTVDSGWLAAAWVVIRQAFPKELGGLATRFLDETDFYEFYDPGIGQLRLGFDEKAGDFSPYHYGLIGTEARVTSLIGIGKGNLPDEHWWFIYRTPPDRWTWQNQVPQGKEVEIDRVTFFEGHYTYHGKKFVPSWGGSMFEFLMPTLVLKEKELAPKGLGLNNRLATEIQIDYALNRQGYPVWGISPASTSSGRQWRYVEYGVKYLGVKGYRDEGMVTPYAAFLALETVPEQAIDNLRRMLQIYPVYGEYGYYDTINVRTGRVNAQYLALDQGMVIAALANYLRRGVLKEYFHKDPIGKKAERFLTREEFFS